MEKRLDGPEDEEKARQNGAKLPRTRTQRNSLRLFPTFLPVTISPSVSSSRGTRNGIVRGRKTRELCVEVASTSANAVAGTANQMHRRKRATGASIFMMRFCGYIGLVRE